MVSRRLHFLLYALSAFLIVFVMNLPAMAQEDSDPNSPTPILLSADDSTRALALPVGSSFPINSKKIQAPEAFAADTNVVLYVTNVELMKGEDATAFRLYSEDAKGRKYRFPVLDLRPVEGREWIYALTVKLRDEIGFWEQPTADGDLLVYVTWRGLASNNLKLGLGRTGGEIRENDRTAAAPISKFLSKPTEPVETDAPEYVGYRFSGDRKRFLEQTTFGPTVALDQRIRRIGLRTWLAEQLEAQYPSTNNPYPYPNFPLKNPDSTNMTTGCGMFTNPSAEYSACIRDHYTMYPVQRWFFSEAFYGEAQLKHRVTWALAQMWVTSGNDIQQSRYMSEYYEVLYRHSLGNFRNLMSEMTLNPAMGDYLDMVRSTRNNPNENYARELMQLFSIGLFMMNQNGTLQLDGQGNPIPTYDQNGVNNLTKVLTGWGFCSLAGPSCPNIVLGIPNYIDPLLLRENNHDLTAKTLLNYPGSTTTNIAACTGCNTAAITTYANNSLNQALNNIFNHPNVAPFVSKYLIQHLVTSDPTPAYVGRVSAVFNNNGQGVRGDMKAVVRAILLDPEARGDFKSDPNYGKLREPVQLMTNIARHFDVRGAGPGFAVQSDGVVMGLTSILAQNVFFSPTVFNFYPPDYIVPGTSMPGPEFAVLNTGTSIARANLGNTLVFGQVNIGAPNVPQGTSLNFAEMEALSTADPTGALLVDTLNTRMLHGRMSSQMRTSILTAVTNIVATNPQQRARQAVYLVATSSQFQIQR